MSGAEEVAALIEEAGWQPQQKNVAYYTRSDASEKDRSVHGLLRC
jgi:2-iminoacetate synthase ThiH